MFIVTVVCGIFKTLDYLGYVWRYYLKASVDFQGQLMRANGGYVWIIVSPFRGSDRQSYRESDGSVQ